MPEARGAMPEMEGDDLGRYLEDTITIDWQTPRVMEVTKELLDGAADAEDRVRRLFAFVRDEIDATEDLDPSQVAEAVVTCRSSEVLKEGAGLSFAKSHLLAGMLRFAGFPTGFCYVQRPLVSEPGRIVLHGFNALYWQDAREWLFLDARGDNESIQTTCRFEAPWSLAYAPAGEGADSFLPFIYRRPPKRIIDLLERAPSLEAVLRSVPDSI